MEVETGTGTLQIDKNPVPVKIKITKLIEAYIMRTWRKVSVDRNLDI